MPRVKSDATKLRIARSELRIARQSSMRAASELADLYNRAAKAEKEAAEWKARFDALLRVTVRKLDGPALAGSTKLATDLHQDKTGFTNQG
jgi:hypothetical protein